MRKLLGKFIANILVLSILLSSSQGIFTTVSYAADISNKSSHINEVPAGYVGIYDKNDLDNVRNNLQGNYILMNNIKFTDEDFKENGDFYNNGKGWTEIGENYLYQFTGVFDGNGYYIDGLTVDLEEMKIVVGLFGINSGTIKNLGMKNVNINMNLNSYNSRENIIKVGTIAGYNYGGIISNCYSEGKINITNNIINNSIHVGGITGYSASMDENSVTSKIESCQNSTDISLSSNSYSNTVGGIVGMTYPTTIVDCSNLATIKGYNYDREYNVVVGGIIGENQKSDVKSSYNKGKIYSSGNCAGIVAQHYDGTVEQCFNSGDLYGGRDYTGGIAAYNGSKIKNCYNTSYIKGKDSVGTIVSHNAGTIEKCYNIGICESDNGYYGVKNIIAGSNNGIISNAYTLKNNNYENQSGVTGLTVTEMKNKGNYIGFDFDNVWEMKNSIPFLKSLGNEKSFVESLQCDSNINLLTNENKQINIKGIDDKLYDLSFTSLDNNIATVNFKGEITGVNEGSTKVIVTENFTEISKIISINVKQGPTEIQIVGDDFVGLNGETKLSVTHEPENVDIGKIIWESSDESVATVDENGLVRGISQSYVTITAKTSNNLSYTHHMNVVKLADTVKFDKEIIYLPLYNNGKLSFKLNSPEASNIGLIWKSSDENIVHAGFDGYIYGNNMGTSTVTVTTQSGNSDSCEVNVYRPIDSIEIDKSEIKVAQGYSTKVNVSIAPEDATYKEIDWKSSDNTVATVDEKGVITGLSKGTCIITGKTKVDNHTIKAIVEVGIPVNNITLDKNKVDLSKGDSTKLTATVLPKEAIMTDVKWTSSDDSIVTVDQNGKINGVGGGSAVITATTTDGTNFKSTCKVNVNSKITDIELDQRDLYIYPDEESKSLNVKILPEDNTENVQLVWTSSDKSVATVDDNGKITPVSGGTTEIRVSLDGTDLKDSCKVYVYRNFDDKLIAEDISTKIYDGSQHRPKTKVKYGNKILQEDKDYYFDYASNTDMGLGKVSIVGMGHYSGIVEKYFDIKLDKVNNIEIEANNFYNKLTWQSVYGAYYYNIYRSTSKNGEYTYIGRIDEGKTNYYDNDDLKYGNTYYYKVVAKGEMGGDVEGLYGDSVSIVANIKSSEIIECKAKSYNSNTLKWKSIDGAHGYEVYRATSKSGTYSLRTTRTSTSYTNTGLTTGKTYYYKVRAYVEVNGEKIYGDFSPVVSAKPILASTTAKATSTSYNSNKITWNGVSGASGYEVYRATSSGGTYSLKKTVTSGSTLSYTNTGLTTGKTYYYKVRAYRLVDGKKVYGSFSRVVSSVPKLTTPTVTLTSAAKKAYVKWSKVSGASGYEIRRATSKSGTYSLAKTITSGSTTSYTNSGLSSKKGYYYKVRAYRMVDGKKVYSSYSSVKYIKTK